KPDSRLERLVDLAKPLRQRRPNFRIADRFRRRRADGEAPSRAGSSRQVARQSQAIDPLKRLAQRPVIGKRLPHRGTTVLPVMTEGAEIEIVLVAERPVEARSIHAGRLAQVIERGSGITGLPEAFDGARERDVGIVGPRPSAPLRLFLYHFESNPWRPYNIMRTSTKIKWKDADGPLFLPARLLHGHTHCILRSRRRSALRGGRSQDQAYSRRSRLLRDQPARSRSGDSHRRRRGHDRECGDPAIRGGLLSRRGPRAHLRHGSCPPATMALLHWNRVAQGLVHALARSKGPRSGPD